MENENKEIDAETVGEILRNSRLKQGKTLSDISKVLCIRKIYLDALEKSDYKTLTPIPYGIGFVRSYAEFLGLNSARIVQTYKQESLPKVEKKENAEAELSEPTKDYNGPTLKHIFIGALGLVLLFVLWSEFASYKFSAPTETDTNSEIVTEPVIIEENANMPTSEELQEMGLEEVLENKNVAENNTNSDSSQVDIKPQKIAEAETPAKQVAENKAEVKEDIKDDAVADATSSRIKIVVTGPSWLEVKHNSEILVSGIYSKGFKYDVPYNENVIVSMGRHYNVDFYIDGQLTKVASSMKQTQINLDKFLKKND